jgi:succinoglycan biosynthesis transport protein ExoP
MVLGVSLLGAGLTYLVTSLRPAEYETATSVAALSSGTGNNVVSSTLVTAPPLPQSVVQNALRSPKVLDLTVAAVKRSALAAAVKTELVTELRAESASGRYNLVRLFANIDPQQQTGLYELRSHARSAQAAQVLADASASALLVWDQDRAAQNITRAQQTLRQQLRNVDARLAANPDPLEQRSLLTTRADTQEKLGQVSALLTAVGGTLSLVSQAQLPAVPVSPQPARDAALVFAALLFFSALGALVLDATRKRVNSVAELAVLGRPLLGVLPLLLRTSAGLLPEARSGHLYESVGFLRVNLASVAAGKTRIVVSSAQPGAGKSTVTAALAQSVAQSGQRVLVVDADLYRPTQLKVWQGAGGQFSAAVTRSGATLYTDVVRFVDLLVPDKTPSDPAHLTALVDDMARHYSLVLIDTPPILVAASTLELSVRVDGVVLVVAAGSETEVVRRAIDNAQVAGSRILGVVLNKASVSSTEYGYYGAYGLNAAEANPAGPGSRTETPKSVSRA